MSRVRGTLETQRTSLSARIAAIAGDFRSIVAASADANADDEHDPEGATIAFERAQTLALLAQARRSLAETIAALERLDSGSYGQCEECGATINSERLAARPAARHCLDCAATRR